MSKSTDVKRMSFPIEFDLCIRLSSNRFQVGDQNLANSINLCRGEIVIGDA